MRHFITRLTKINRTSRIKRERFQHRITIRITTRFGITAIARTTMVNRSLRRLNSTIDRLADRADRQKRFLHHFLINLYHHLRNLLFLLRRLYPNRTRVISRVIRQITTNNSYYANILSMLNITILQRTNHTNQTSDRLRFIIINRRRRRQSTNGIRRIILITL